jgi:hypothetical protein
MFKEERMSPRPKAMFLLPLRCAWGGFTIFSRLNAIGISVHGILPHCVLPLLCNFMPILIYKRFGFFMHQRVGDFGFNRWRLLPYACMPFFTPLQRMQQSF